jgi:putative ABC transport system permease protein
MHEFTAIIANYIKVSVRNILKYKVFSFINMFGLAVAMSICMLLILMLVDQKRYDQFHEKKDRVYRILSGIENSNQYATSPFPLAASLKTDYPIIEETALLTPGVGGDVRYQQKFAEMRGYFAEPSFFNVFSFQLTEGDKLTALEKPNSIVLSKKLAKELFGNENATGKVVEFDDRQLAFPITTGGTAAPAVSWGNFTVTGTIDESSYKSHLKFDVLMSASSIPVLVAEKKMTDQSGDWIDFFKTYTFVLLQNEKTEQELSGALIDFVKRKYADIEDEQVKGFGLWPQKLADVQLELKSNDTNNRLPLVGYYFIAILALVIMFSASLNYTNLTIARALTRAKEIGVRKVTGASRRSLIFQFLSESVIVSLLSMVLAVFISLFVANQFKGLWVNQYLNFELPQSPVVCFIFIGFALLVGLLAGLYPALYLSTYQPVKALKNLNNIRPGKLGMRKVLSVSQFTISLIFIITSILIFNQFKFFMEFDYGFNAKNIVNIELQGADYQKVATEFGSIPGVTAISHSDLIPATGTNNGNEFKKFGAPAEEFKPSNILFTDQNFTDNLNIKLIAGKPLPPTGESSERFVLVNREFTKKFGYQNPAEVIGETFETKWAPEAVQVVGVVEDFHFLLLVNRDAMRPLMLRNQPSQFKYANVKISSGNPMATVALMEQKWRLVEPSRALQYTFYDDELSNTHQAIFDLVSVIGFIAFLAVIIACLGLLGMATFTAERKTKEIGIRKVLGADGQSIALLLSKEFVIVLLIAVAIGAPLSYFGNSLWLQAISNRVSFGVGTVLLGALVLLSLGFVTIASQTIRASKKNPVESLRVD